ncbi:MAG: hypothetical protein NC483_05965 [Ruminococcus sp.]|nr:hypothetical protein [Ruminococcus sp.]
MFENDYYLEKLKDLMVMELDVENFKLVSSFFYDHNRCILNSLCQMEEFMSIIKAFNSLHPNIKYLLNYYIIENNNLLDIAIKYNIKLLDLALYIEFSLGLLRNLYFEQYNSRLILN